jgi:hypothetical protein
MGEELGFGGRGRGKGKWEGRKISIRSEGKEAIGNSRDVQTTTVWREGKRGDLVHVCLQDVEPGGSLEVVKDHCAFVRSDGELLRLGMEVN